MKSSNSRPKEFDTVETFRKIKAKISKDISNMSFAELHAYLDKNKLAVSKKS